MQMSRFALCAFLCVLYLFTAGVPSAQAASATVSGKLADRQCSVEDVYGLQPQNQKYCVLTIRETYTIGGIQYVNLYTVYCPSQLHEDGFTYNSYDTCSDPAALQVNHPTRIYIVQGALRTPTAAMDGRGQIIATQIQF